MPGQRKMTRRQALMLAAFMPIMIVAGIAVYARPFWELAIAIAMLVLAAVVFVLLWRTNSDDPRDNRKFMLWGYLVLLPIVAILVVVRALAKVSILQQVGLDIQAAMVLGIFFVGPLILLPPLLLLKRKRRGLQRLMTDEEKQREEEFKQIIRHMPTGWGMRPEETIKEGLSLFWGGGIVGGITSAGAGAFVIYIGLHGLEQLKDIIYFALSLLVCLAGISVFFFSIFDGLKYWRAGRRWREQATGTVTIEGIYADEYIGENDTLMKIQRKDGNNKILLIRAFYELLPEVGEEVQIEYLFCCEAVIDVKPLAGSGGSVPSEPFPLRGGSES